MQAPTPSITVWTRLEPQSRDDALASTLRTSVHDPLWLLARQWQVGEFLGDDAGSPIHAAVRIESVPLTSYLPGTSANPPVAFAAGIPLQTHVEREPMRLGVRASVQLGLRFEAMLAETFAGGSPLQNAANVGLTPANVRDLFRQAFAITSAEPSDVPDAASQAFRRFVASRMTDGLGLLASVRGDAGSAPLPPVASDPGLQPTLQRFLTFAQSLYSEPSYDSAWVSDRLEYRFALGAQTTADDVALAASEYRGATLDWYTCSITDSWSAATDQPPSGLRTDVAGATPSAPIITDQVVVPNHITFAGMPTTRWWTFEDGRTDFGELDTRLVDLPKMLVAECNLLYGNDWFEVPIPLPIGALARVTLLLVTNTFGERMLVRATEAQTPPLQRPWSMFRLSRGSQPSDWLFLPPTLDMLQEGPALEDILFVRDDMAAIAWAIEQTLQSPLDRPVDGYEAYRQRLAALPPAAPAASGGPEVEYLVGTAVPDNWIPLVPVVSPDGRYFLRRGVIEREALGGGQVPPARGRVLEPWHPFYVEERTVSRAGTEVMRHIRRARWSDGSTHVWGARQTRPGRGSGWSGLAFDVLRRMTP